jgi:DNA end-binding protein Ku
VKKPALILLMLALLAAVAVLRRSDPSPGEAVAPARSLDSMTRDELYDLARQLDIPGRSRMKKTELRAALSRAGRSG